MPTSRNSLKTLALVPSATYERPTLHSLRYAQPTSVQLRDGDVVVFRRSDSPLWQFRYHIKNGAWHPKDQMILLTIAQDRHALEFYYFGIKADESSDECLHKLYFEHADNHQK